MSLHGILQTHSFHAHALDEIGMPNLAYEYFYQQGMSCYYWGLPRPYVLQALRALCVRYSQRFGAVSFWQLRAFAYGLLGLDSASQRPRRCPNGYQWPLPPDEAWETVVCLYPDGLCDFDFVHPVSRRFWSEDNGFLELPSCDPLQLGGWWFEEMGFVVMRMQPSIRVCADERAEPHLKLVR